MATRNGVLAGPALRQRQRPAATPLATKAGRRAAVDESREEASAPMIRRMGQYERKEGERERETRDQRNEDGEDKGEYESSS